jgi:hypothetical protein
VGTAPTATYWNDGKKSTEKFANLKAEMWWRLRVRVERSYQYAVMGISHPQEDMLSLPPGADTEALIAQLSGVRYFETETGKIIVESKKQLSERGVASPDLAEALVLSFAPTAISSRATRSGDSRPVSTDAVSKLKKPRLPATNGHRLIPPPKPKRGGGGRSA